MQMRIETGLVAVAIVASVATSVLVAVATVHWLTPQLQWLLQQTAATQAEIHNSNLRLSEMIRRLKEMDAILTNYDHGKDDN